MTFRFWFIHDTDTCHHTSLKLGRRSETGREKRVTPEFGERKEEKKFYPQKNLALEIQGWLAKSSGYLAIRSSSRSQVASSSE
jgi:hypothetical protein